MTSYIKCIEYINESLKNAHSTSILFENQNICKKEHIWNIKNDFPKNKIYYLLGLVNNQEKIVGFEIINKN